VNFSDHPTPPQLFRQFERGEISREELQASMAVIARDLIDEMEESNKNPKTSYIERLRNLAAVKKLSRSHGPALVREVLIALGQIEGFPPAQILWNAGHSDVPLHCFIRSKIEPVFRIKRMDVEPMEITLDVEYGAHDKKKTARETIVLERDAMLTLSLRERNPS